MTQSLSHCDPEHIRFTQRKPREGEPISRQEEGDRLLRLRSAPHSSTTLRSAHDTAARNDTPAPKISVVISTRDRGESVAATLESILRNDFPCFEIRVIDQSADGRTERALQPFLSDHRLCYERSATRGLAAGRNAGIAGADGALIAVTDDDCVVPSNWLREIAAAFASDCRIGIVLGNMMPAPHDRRAGFVQGYVRQQPFLAQSLREMDRIEGVGACMAFRRNMWNELGGFDEMLGAGAPFKSAEETDLYVRALLGGFMILETPRVFVTHYGFRTWEQSRPLIRGYISGRTAMYVKHFKSGNWRVIYPCLHLVWRWAFGRPVVDLGHVPSRWLRLKGFADGLVMGMLTPVDRTSCLYVEPEQSAA